MDGRIGQKRKGVGKEKLRLRKFAKSRMKGYYFISFLNIHLYGLFT